MLKTTTNKNVLKFFGFIIILCFIILLSCNLIVILYSKPYVFSDLNGIPTCQAAVILGAKTYDGYLSRVLKQKVDIGILLLKNKKSEKLLLSGDHGTKNYDEVNNMKNYVLKNAPEIEQARIFLDHAGFDTYNSATRARAIFEIESAIFVSQRFHVYRAVFIARNKGIQAFGFAGNEEEYSINTKLSWNIREIFGRTKAVFDVVLNSDPKYYGEKISIHGDGRKSWD